MKWRNAWLWPLVSLVLCAQQPVRIATPRLGYYLGEGNQLLQVEGIPGAARIGDPVDLPAPLRHALVSPDGRRIAAVSADEGVLWLTRTDSGMHWTTVAEAITRVTQIAWASEGDTLLLYSAAEASLQAIVGGVASAPVRMDKPAEEATCLAVTTDGATAVVGFADVRGASLVIWQRSSRELTVRRVDSRCSQAGFLPHGEGLLALFADEDRLLYFPSVLDAGAPVRVVVDRAAGLDRPVGFVALASGRIVVANATGSVLLTSLSGDNMAIERLTANVMITGLLRLGSEPVFALNSPGDGPIWVLDTVGTAPALRFIAAR